MDTIKLTIISPNRYTALLVTTVNIEYTPDRKRVTYVTTHGNAHTEPLFPEMEVWVENTKRWPRAEDR